MQKLRESENLTLTIKNFNKFFKLLLSSLYLVRLEKPFKTFLNHTKSNLLHKNKNAVACYLIKITVITDNYYCTVIVVPITIIIIQK